MVPASADVAELDGFDVEALGHGSPIVVVLVVVGAVAAAGGSVWLGGGVGAGAWRVRQAPRRVWTLVGGVGGAGGHGGYCPPSWVLVGLPA